MQPDCVPSSTYATIATAQGGGSFLIISGLPENLDLALQVLASDAHQQVIARAELMVRIASAAPTSAGSGTGSTRLPPPINLPLPAMVPGANIAYDFRGTEAREAPDAAVLRLIVQSGALKGASAAHVSGTLYNLKHSRSPRPFTWTGNIDANGTIDTAVEGLDPETVYRLEDVVVSVPNDGGNSEAVGDPYFLVTTGNTALSIGRRLVVMRALAEAYDWDHNNYDRSKDYANESGWCDRFYSWATTGAFTIRYPDYAPDWFDENGALVDANALPGLAAQEGVHGDMIRYDGLFLGFHTFMILAYDADEQRLWTVEGNYNDRVERADSTIKAGYRLGHLNPALLGQ